MPFPISMAGSFYVDVPEASDQDASRLKTAISEWLHEKRARSVSSTARGVSFRVGNSIFTPSWNPLVAISSGEIEIVPQETGIKVAYRLRFTQMLVLVTAMVILFLGPPILTASNLTPMQASLFLLMAWLWLFGGNYVITLYRVPRALKRIARQTTGRFE